MDNTSDKDSNQIDPLKERKFFEEEGSTRAITSGSLSMIFALIGSTCVWLFMILATSSDILPYFGLTTAINGIIGVFGIGIQRSFIVEIKEAQNRNKGLAIIKATAYSKILLVVGIILGTLLIIIGFILDVVLQNELFRICLIASGVFTFMGYTNAVFFSGLEVKNRYDILAFLSIFGGIFLLLWAYMFITFKWNPIFFAFHPFFNISTLFLFYYYFQKHSDYSFKDVIMMRLTTKSMIKKSNPDIQELLEVKQIRTFLKESVFSMLTNMESLGIFGNLLVFFAAFYIWIFTPALQGIAISLLTIVMTYGAVKTVILYYSAPLNNECAEAQCKDFHKIIEDSVNDSTRVSSILAMAFVIGMIALSGELLLLLHGNIFITNGVFDSELFSMAQTLFIMIVIGQFVYGYATLFGNALIGSGNARYAAMGFGMTALIIIGASPLFIFLFGILGVGIVMLISVAFLLPYMVFQLKRQLKIKLHFKLGRLAPNLVILYILFVFLPFQGISGLVIRMVIGTVIYMMLNPFFGVSIPEDIQMINDLFKTIKLKPLGKLFAYSMKGMYNISPFNEDKITLK